METTRSTRRNLMVVLLLIVIMAGSFVGCQRKPDPIVNNPKPAPAPAPSPSSPVGDNKPTPTPDFLILINASHPLADKQEPKLKTVQGSFKLQETAADAMIELLQAAELEGIKLEVVSSYRSYAKQQQLFQSMVESYIKQGYARAEAEKTTATIRARPGTSEHNAGLAADVVTPEYRSLNANFAKTEAAKWLAANCSRFGYILRYPKDKQEITGIIFEPWHFRYVGKPAAEEIMSQGLCLEEYLGK